MAEKSAPILPDDFEQVKARIAELEAEVKQLRNPNQVYPTKGGRVAIYAQEITTQKRVETDVRRQAEVLEQVYDSIISTDLQGNITRWNQGAQRIFGYQPDEVLGKHVKLLYFEEDQPTVNPHLLEPLRRGGLREFELRHRRKSGEECFIRLCLSQLHDEAGHPYGILGVGIDITAQKRAEQALRESEERYRSLANAIPQVVYLTSPDGKTEMVNQRWEQYSGLAAEKSLNLDCIAWVHPDDVQAHTAHWLQCLQSGSIFEHEYRLRDKNGEYRWHLARAVPVRNQTGVIKQWVGTSTDIHQQKLTEEALRASEERFRLAFQAIHGIVYDWYPQTGRVHRSGNLSRLLGVSLDEAEQTEHWWQNHIHPDDAHLSSLNVLARLSKDQSTYETEFRMWHADGEWVHISDRGFVIRDQNGTPIRVVGSSHDITKGRRLENALQQSNQQLQFQAGILAATDDAVIALDSNQLIRYCNAAAERMYAVQASQVIGKPLSAVFASCFLHPDDEKRALSDLARFGQWRGENKHIRRNGTAIFVSSTVNVLSPESGGGTVAVIRDISTQKQIEANIQNNALQLARANQDLLHFAYAASHDLQAPLRTIKSFSQLLALKYRARLDERGDEFLRWIVDASSRMETMLRDLLEFAKVAGGEAECNQQVALEDALATALESLRGAIQETQAVVTHDPLPTLAGHSSQFIQLFENLIGNSLKYRKPNLTPQIHISTSRTDSDWIISVRDNGIGFKPEYSEKIFGVFQRLHTSEFSGTGIGLSICKRIVERRGGRIWATSEPEAGAAFFFSVPLNESVSTNRLESLPSAPVAASSDPTPSNPHFDELFQALALVPAIARNLDGTITLWTKGSQNLFGWSETEAIGSRLHTLLKMEFPQPIAEIEAILLRKGEWTGELKAHKRDGTPVWLSGHKILYRDGSGRPQSVIEVHSDITALKEAEAALARSSEQRDLALRAGQMGIWRWDNRTGVVEWSETIEAFLGMPPGSFEGTYEAFQKRGHPDDQARTRENIAKAFESGGDYAVENRLLRNDGSYAWVRGQGKVVYDEHHQPVGLIGVVWDISQRKQSEADKQFLLDLSTQFSHCLDPDALTGLAVDAIATYLNVTQCVFSEADTESPLRECLQVLAGNSFVAVSNLESDPRTSDLCQSAYLAHGIRAFLAVPLHRNRVTMANLVAVDKNIRTWQEREIALLQGVTERLAPMLENARLLREARERHAQFESTFEQAAVGLAHVALDGRWLRVNQRICDITGYSREELLASRFQDITHPDDLAADLLQYQALQRGETQSYSIEKRYFHKTGSIVWINLTVAILRDNSGTPRYAISVVEDITQRKNIARQLEESNSLAELRLREIEAIYSQAPVGLLFLDKDLRFVRINEYLAKNNGVPQANHLGRTISEVLPHIAPHLNPLLQSVIETRQPIVEMELRGTRLGYPNSESTWLVSYFPVEAPDRTLLGLNGVVQDITERKIAEAARLEATDRLRIATSAAKLGIFVWDAQNDRSTWENARVYEIIGRDPADGPINNREFLENVIHPDDVASHMEAFNHAMQSGEPFRSVFRIRQGNGETRWIDCSGQFDIAKAGQPLRLIGVIADITERMTAEQVLRNQKQHLRRVLDSLFIFVGVLDLNGVLLETNHARLEADGIKPGDIVGKLLPDTYWWSYSTEVQARIWDSIHKARAGESSRFDIQARMQGGQLITLDWMIAPLRNDVGEIEFLIPSAVPIQERKQIEAELRESEERYRLAECATNDGLWDWNLVTDDCYFSPRFKALLGFEDHEFQNKASAAFDLMHPDDAPLLYEAVRLHLAERKPYDVEIRVRHKNGAYRWFRSRGEAIFDATGKPVRMVGAMTDITERKEAEALSNQHDQQWHLMLDSFEQLAWMANADGYIFWYNRRWYEYTGTTPDQMEGWGWQSVHDPKLLPAVMDGWLESIRTGEPFRMEFPLRGADGIYRPFLTRVVPVRDYQGEVIRWFGTNTNVEALRREQDLLKESERRFRELAESIPEMVWTADAQGRINYWNPQLYAYTGLSQNQGMADNWVTIIHPEDADRLFQLWQHSVATGSHHEYESRMRRHDGTYRWFLNRAEPIRGDTGNIVKWIGTSTDIHEQKLTEQALRHSNEDLEQFAYAASHDLQEPLRTVAIYSQLLARNYGHLDADASRFATYVVNGVKRMDCLLKGILAYSRIGDSLDESNLCNAEAVLKIVLQNLAQSIQEAAAEITHDPLPPVACSETHLLQLLQNLIGNALKYRAHRAPIIHVSVTSDAAFHQFSISDNGIGIKPEYSQQIFGMFKRLYRDEYPGIGVGLAICKRIVERHGGKIWLHSEPGVGTTFYFTLPAAK